MATEVAIGVDDLTSDSTRELIALHHANMHAITPAESVHALDLAGLAADGVVVLSAVARAGDSAPKTAAVGAISWLDAENAELKAMRVSDEFRGTGLGRRILEALIEHARTAGATTLWLETGSTPEFLPAVGLYESTGFVRCAPFGGYVEDPLSIFMRLDLPSGSGA